MMFRLAVWIFLLAAPVHADEISVALTEQQISIDEGFSGARIILYGVVSGAGGAERAPGDLVVIVRGPEEDLAVREKRRTGPIWTAGEPVRVAGAPGFYFLGATRALNDILSPDERTERQIGAGHLSVSLIDAAAGQRSPDTLEIARAAIVEAMSDRALYREDIGAVSFLDGGLFQVAIDFPANTPVGPYRSEIYLLRAGEIVAWRTAPLYVEKVGLERMLYDLAHQRPLTYGLLCVAMSLFAGWLASVLFRR
ncbi:MAG: TIGR02186 family protein [Pseudomonadota bacterium]